MYVGDKCNRKLLRRRAEMKTNDAIHLRCQIIHFMYFAFMGNGLFPQIAMDHISKKKKKKSVRANAPDQYHLCHGQNLPFVL